MTVRSASVLLGLGLLLAACTSGGGQPAAAGPSTSASAPSEEPPAPTPTPAASLPGGCDEVLPFTDLDQALGRPQFGATRFVLGVAQPSIGRTGRVTCQYGLAPGGKGGAPVEVGMSTYKDEASATERVAATVASLRSGATSQATTTIDGAPATLVGSKTAFTTVLAQGKRTLAVTVLRSLKGVYPDKAAVAVAAKVLANWGQ